MKQRRVVFDDVIGTSKLRVVRRDDSKLRRAERVLQMELRVVRLTESIFQTNHRLFPRSSSVVRPNQSVFPKYQAMILEEPSLGSMSASRCSMTLRVSFDDEEKRVEKQCVVVTDEAVFSMDV